MTSKSPAYVILGRGRWAQVMHRVLSAEHRAVATIGETRRRAEESDADFRSRLGAALDRPSAQIAWLCVPPAPDVPLIIEVCVQAGLHVVVEKPWLCSRPETDRLVELAQRSGVLVAVHYQYCFLERVQEWRRNRQETGGLQFSGRFTVSRPDRLGIPALWNLGSHLLAIRGYAVAWSQISGIVCGYNLPDERYVRLEDESGNIDSIDFASNREPLIQRFIAALEQSLTQSEFPLDLRFAMRVSEAVRSIESG